MRHGRTKIKGKGIEATKVVIFGAMEAYPLSGTSVSRTPVSVPAVTVVEVRAGGGQRQEGMLA